MNVQSSAQLSSAHCRFIAEQTLRLSGVNVDPSKRDFIHLRVSKRLKALDLGTFDDYIGLLKSEADGSEARNLVEALTTHTTSFFREGHQYEWLEQEGLERLARTHPGGASPLSVWSAASSTGAELWSAGMVLMDAAKRNSGTGNFALIGTDISRRILKTAQNATYSKAETEGVSELRRSRYLMQSKQRFGASNQYYYRVVPELRKKSRFEIMNLSKLHGSRRFSADIVFLRNVLIYFEEATQRDVLDNVISRLRPGGILFTGHAEAVPPRSDLRVLAPSTYEKV